MTNYRRDNRDSLRRLADSAEVRADAATSSAQSHYATAEAAHSAATGVWVGAGFQAATALTAAKQHRLQQQQFALEQESAQRQADFNYKMWRQTPNGANYLDWCDRAIGFIADVEARDDLWAQAWEARVARLRSEIPADEVQTLNDRWAMDAKLASAKRRASMWWWTVGIIVAVMFSAFVVVTIGTGVVKFFGGTGGFNANGFTVVGFLLFAGALTAAILETQRKSALKAALVGDNQWQVESAKRVERWGFDPMLVSHNYVGVNWHFDAHLAERLDRCAYLIHHPFDLPVPESLPHLTLPDVWQASGQYAGEVVEASVAIRDAT